MWPQGGRIKGKTKERKGEEPLKLYVGGYKYKMMSIEGTWCLHEVGCIVQAHSRPTHTAEVPISLPLSVYIIMFCWAWSGQVAKHRRPSVEVAHKSQTLLTANWRTYLRYALFVFVLHVCIRKCRLLLFIRRNRSKTICITY